MKQKSMRVKLLAKKRVYELAKELNTTSKRLMEKLEEINIVVKNHMSFLEEMNWKLYMTYRRYQT